MSNSYFQFKKFKIEQGNCAMKVGTDGVLLGAWAFIYNPKQILDIGTGTGLIALMLAQKFETAKITALEIDTLASNQASQNFKASNWYNRLTRINKSLQSFETLVKFDLIVSNPPYFNNSEKNPDKQKQTARHTDTLSYYELIEKAFFLLSKTGAFCVILPYSSKDEFIKMCKINKLFLAKELAIKPTPSKEYKRVLLEFSKTKALADNQELIIEEFGRHQYSEKYIQLTKEFYLKF